MDDAETFPQRDSITFQQKFRSTDRNGRVNTDDLRAIIKVDGDRLEGGKEEGGGKGSFTTGNRR